MRRTHLPCGCAVKICRGGEIVPDGERCAEALALYAQWAAAGLDMDSEESEWREALGELKQHYRQHEARVETGR